MSRKTYVLDTNVLLHNPEALFDFEEHEVVIPFTVLGEVDDHKKRQDEIGKNARIINKHLEELRLCGKLNEGVKIKEGKGIIRIELNHVNNSSLPKSIPSLNMNKADNRILAVALGLKHGKPRSAVSSNVILVTKDINLRVRADVCGLEAQDYLKDKVVDYGEMYTGFSKIELTAKQIGELQEYKVTTLVEGQSAFPNQFFIYENGSKTPIVACCKSDRLVSLDLSEKSNWGLESRNIEQRMALELLTDEAIPVVSVVGTAGTGKTILSLAVGLEMVVQQRIYDKLIVLRPMVPMGDPIGFLPGNKEEKVDPWMQPIYDNLCYLMRDCENPMEEINDLKVRGGLEIGVLTYIRGRSIPRQFIICDEAQNMTPLMIKTLVTRVGEGTKIVFTGDPSQIDNPFLDASSNGLSYLVERIKQEEISGHVTLIKGERSKVAEICSQVL
jgi:PhoH-like ATPase